uniref:ribosomal protein S3 n=1 Tax=Erythrolobus coxiae TaxID=362235 RepID=UPI001FCCF76F|nr:ribosomal protein S3 [Erythrolobus coxiae]UNJ19004.1 ribosomal protein S3 [Erythrolobus coxiae]
MTQSIHPLNSRYGWINLETCFFQTYNNYSYSFFVFKKLNFENYLMQFFTNLNFRKNNYKIIVHNKWIVKRYLWIWQIIFIYTKIKHIQKNKQKEKSYKFKLSYYKRKFWQKVQMWCLRKKKKVFCYNSFKFFWKNNLNVFFYSKLITNFYRVHFWFNTKALILFFKSHIERNIAFRKLFIVTWKQKIDKLDFSQKKIFLTKYGYFVFKLQGLKIRCSGRFFNKRSQMSRIFIKQKKQLKKINVTTFIDFFQTCAFTRKGSVGLAAWFSYNFFF